jgi:predicted ester cyclase
MSDHVGTLHRLFADVWNGANLETADEHVHERYRINGRSLSERLRGPELHRALASGTRETFPGATFVIEDTIAEDDRVALRWTMTGTHEGRLFGVDPTGRRVELRGIEMDRFADDRLVETWTRTDRLGLAERLGAFDARNGRVRGDCRPARRSRRGHARARRRPPRPSRASPTVTRPSSGSKAIYD